ncbi:DUF6527 family protein [Parasphingorhabdus sp.]|uniref:DUF6527 family protein n=1 Tax=Parasphingorhabdus sp. TaxID=2709688 RepID=UPI002B273883|nr:DUF6527 family protein [Parasphingorhabdus sp.]|tara:strand:+ start:2477 stop:2899 length:423 start_codon:yes stop_codon:yes gene_type:complete
MRFEHRFVEDIPNKLEPRVLYIALDCGAVVHLCACGCGNEAVTPLGPTDWSISYDGETVSLSPSVGNWSFLCRSHYFIEDGCVRWAPQWSNKQIEEGRRCDRALKNKLEVTSDPGNAGGIAESERTKASWLSRAVRWLVR